jgi:hypothetical protein
MTATTPQKNLAHAAETGQEAISTAIRTWGETVKTALGVTGAGRGGDGPSPGRLVDAWFEVAGEALTAQREFAKVLLAAGDSILDVMSRAATGATNVAPETTEEASQEGDQAATRAAQPAAARKDR